MQCLDDASLLELAEGRRSLERAHEAHLAECSECRFVLAAAARGAEAAVVSDQSDESEPAWDELGVGVIVAKRYELTRFLGRGGMGAVWAARRTTDGLDVAIKIAKTPDAELGKRLEREASVVAALGHPNVAKTLDFVAATHNRGPCFVQELLIGETLEAHLRQHHVLPLERAARIVVPVASALAAAHGKGIVHRDIKPANVFLAGPRIVVLDFGIAKLLPAWGNHSALTYTGALLGTPHYMAPEQIFGDRIDARVDVWALGAMLFRALTGRGVIEGNSLGQIMKALDQWNPSNVSACLPRMPAEVLGLLEGALRRDPSRRISDVLKFVGTLAPLA